jgi:hypothetical protein
MGLLSPEQMAFVGRYKRLSGSTPTAPVQTSPATSQTTPSRQISAMALDQVGLRNLQRREREILDIVIAAHRNGVADLTGKEIQARYRVTHPGSDIDPNSISPRVGGLIAAGLLERMPSRHCSITNVIVGPVRAVAQQARMAG